MLLKAVMKIYLNECLQTLITIKNHAINSFIVIIKREEKCVAKVWNKKQWKRSTLLFSYPHITRNSVCRGAKHKNQKSARQISGN